VDLDLPQRASIAVAPDVLRTILAEVLQNALDELMAARRQRLQIAAHTDADDVLIDVIDDGGGVAFANPYAAFKPNRSLRGGARGRGLFDAEQLARRIDGQLVLMTHAHGGVLNGAHFRLIVPRGTVQSN
jgi:C4-dicarboxylate-specific signal transduction histidine kinase